MSTPAYQYIQPIDWMQPQHPYQLVNQHSTIQHTQPYANTSSDTPYGYEQTPSFQQPYQHYEDAGYAAHPVIQQTHSPQPDLRTRRQNSTSTNSSFHSFKSPYPNATQLSYSAAFDNGYIDPSYDAYHGSAQYQKHLPTPTRTPTQEVIMDGQRGYDRRSGAPMMGQRHPKDDGPNTPRTMNGDQDDYNGRAHGQNRVPTFDRTYSAIVQDELYDPNALRNNQQPPQQPQPNKHLAPGPYRNMVADRVHAANEARVGRGPIGRVSREPSPFRQNSLFAGGGPTFPPHVGSAAGQRQQLKAESDAIAYQRHHQPRDESNPRTISPREAVLDYHEQPEDALAGPPLFPQSSATSDGSNYDGHRNYGPPPGARQQPYPQYQPPVSNFNFAAPSMPASAHPSSNQLDYRFATQQYKTEPSEDSHEQPDYPAHLISMDTSKSEQEGESHESDVERPASTTADGGTYTCTYHGCSQRFATPALLQKHKREGHRASVSESSPQQPASPGGSTPTRNSQAGPHRCDRINPSTGKPCNTVFSRPYDLTRHEDTIHAQRTKVRCQYCTEEKTFSRNDALTRHMRVVHPNIDFPGKHRRRPTEP